MNASRISPAVVAAIGVVLCLLSVVGIWFLLIKPTQDSTVIQQARYDANYSDSTPQAQAKAKKLLADNTLAVQQIKQKWGITEAALMPPYDVGGDRFKALRQLTYELTHYLGPDLERQMKTTGVASTVTFKLPPPPISPNDITNAPVVIPLSTITVNGDFRRILTHFYDWQYFNRLVLVDGLALHGNSPYMQGSYTATVYIFPQNDDKPAPPPVKGASGGAAAPGGRSPMGGTPASMGGMPTGMPMGGASK